MKLQKTGQSYIIVLELTMSNQNVTIKKIPYGLSDYEKIVTEHYYYVDKTMYLNSIEEAGDYLFFIRPRRFGKSLFLSVMETYYDILKGEKYRNGHQRCGKTVGEVQP